jgi:hypothetical protein
VATTAAAGAATLLVLFVAGFFAAPCVAARRSCDCRLRRAFFFTCDLRRFIFIELRRSCFPTAPPLPVIPRSSRPPCGRATLVRGKLALPAPGPDRRQWLCSSLGSAGAAAFGPVAPKLTGALGYRRLAPADFEPVPTVYRFDIEDLAASDSQDALDGCRDVLMHPIREFDHDNGSLARSAHEPASNGTGTLPELAQHHVHTMNLAFRRAASTPPLTPRSRRGRNEGMRLF